MATKVALKRITVAQALKDLANGDTTLYVLNRARPEGNINFVITSNGVKVSVQAPITWVPVDLTMFCDKEDILKNPDFRRVVSRDFVHIVDSAEAEAFIANEPKASKEIKRILDVNNRQTDIGDIDVPLDEQINAAPPAQTYENNFIANMVLRIASGEETEDDLINELDSKEHSLEIADLTYLMDHTTNPGVKAWCAEAIATRP